MADFNIAVTKLIAREGGDKIVNKPDDAGGLTKFGISQKTYPKVSIASLTEALARQLYRADFWDKIHGDEIVSQAVAENVLDAAVLDGYGFAAHMIQAIAGVNQDGVIGSATVHAINAVNEAFVVALFKNARVSHYVDIVTRRRDQEKFFLGWVGRAITV